MSSNDDIRVLLQSRRAGKQLRDEQGRFHKKTVDEIAASYGLDTSDLRVRALAARDDVQDVEREVLRLAVRIKNTKPDETEMQSHVSGRTSIMNRQEQLEQEYNDGSKNLYGAALVRFKQRMRERGWNG